MKVDIYRSTKIENMYVSVPEGSDVAQINFPEDCDPDLLPLTPFKIALELDLSKPRVGINQEDIYKQITEKGYAVHSAEIETTINLTGSPLN